MLDAVSARTQVPHRAELIAAACVAALAAAADLRTSIGFSAFTILLYYAITNACALRLRAPERRYPRVFAWIGMTACFGLAFSLPLDTTITGLVTVAAGSAVSRALSRGSGRATRR